MALCTVIDHAVDPENRDFFLTVQLPPELLALKHIAEQQQQQQQ